MDKSTPYRIAWKVIPRLPQAVVLTVAHIAADVTYLLNGSSVKQLKTNYERFSGGPVTKKQVREGVRSYFRCFAQQFSMAGWTSRQLDEGCIYPTADRAHAAMQDGPLVLALTHSGNWDLAGAWFCQNWGGITTVAEVLEPRDLFDQFVKFRSSLGMEILGVEPGKHIFNELVETVRGRSLLVPLLADRDISGSGIEVELGASKALVAAGPAALALKLDRPLIAGHISYRKIRGKWKIFAHFTDPIEVPAAREGQSDVEALTQAWVDTIAPVMVDHMVDWHMMQKVFIDDLDMDRLARARKRARDARETNQSRAVAPEAKEGDARCE